MTAGKPRLAFVSPLFLFPADAGGKIRTTNILRGLKGGAFDITLLSPAPPDQRHDWAIAMAGICDRHVAWRAAAQRPRWRRAWDLLGRLPVNVAADRTSAALSAVRDTLRTQSFDVVVFDFVHAAVLKPARLRAATLCFTHNVEAEIFARHAQQARQAIMRCSWAARHRKMERCVADQASAVIALLRDGELRRRLSRSARQCVEARFGHQVAAAAFERICLDALQAYRADPAPVAGA